MRRYLMFAPAALLAACGSSPSATITSDDGTETRITVEQDGDNAEVHAATDHGENVTMHVGEGTDAALPMGFTAFPGAKVVNNTSVTAQDGTGSVVSMLTDASPADVTAFYRHRAEAAGIAIQMETTNNSAQMIAGEAPGGKHFMLNAAPGEDGTTVTLMVGTKPGG